jgi:hypothetical protein
MDGKHLSNEAIKALAMDAATLAKMGVGMPRINSAMRNMIAMDSITQPVTTPSVGTPVQFLQEFLAGLVYILTTARKADTLAPVMTVGRWSDQEIVQQVLEHLGAPGLYKDHGDLPLTSWNLTYDRRDIVRFELGLQQQILEDERGQAIDLNSAQEKRAAVALAFEILRNEVFFNGYTTGGMRTYGILNDPNLPNFVTVAAGGGGGTEWSGKTVDERISDIVTAIQSLRLQSGSNIDPKSMALTLGLPSNVVDLMHDVDGPNTYGYTVQKWLNENYPNITVEAIPQFENANAGESVFYLYAESVPGTGTDDGRSIYQLVSAKMQPLNTVQTVKGFDEGYTNALAGCYVKRGYAIVRFTGV